MFSNDRRFVIWALIVGHNCLLRPNKITKLSKQPSEMYSFCGKECKQRENYGMSVQEITNVQVQVGLKGIVWGYNSRSVLWNYRLVQASFRSASRQGRTVKQSTVVASDSSIYAGLMYAPAYFHVEVFFYDGNQQLTAPMAVQVFLVRECLHDVQYKLHPNGVRLR